MRKTGPRYRVLAVTASLHDSYAFGTNLWEECGSLDVKAGAVLQCCEQRLMGHLEGTQKIRMQIKVWTGKAGLIRLWRKTRALSGTRLDVIHVVSWQTNPAEFCECPKTEVFVK